MYDICAMSDISSKVSSFDLLFVICYLLFVICAWHFLKFVDKLLVKNSRETENNLLKPKKNSCKNVRENLKLAMKKVG